MRLFTRLLFICVLGAAPASAAAAPFICAPRSDVVKRLAEKYSERPMAMGFVGRRPRRRGFHDEARVDLDDHRHEPKRRELRRRRRPKLGEAAVAGGGRGIVDV